MGHTDPENKFKMNKVGHLLNVHLSAAQEACIIYNILGIIFWLKIQHIQNSYGSM